MKTILRILDVDLSQKLKGKDDYKTRLKTLQLQLLKIQRYLYQQQRKAIIVFEGWDAAGKGGSIRRLVERLDPRGYAVHPIGAPNAEERSRHYLHRFWTRLPQPGSLGIFDRSWYGRVLVERVEGLCAEEAWRRAYDEINAFERMLVDDGTPIVKLFLHISKREQLKRFRERENDPFKDWKITKDDWNNRKHWTAYETAIDDMFARTSTREVPWHVIPSEHKWFGRVEALSTIVDHLCGKCALSKKLPQGWKILND
ncbi:MAG: UDP-galactose-lipid carrier transferase [Planctomycetes bacterium]|nr:UDP-galactose-lipid carrier transferase [Planctomycetota bacterium]NUQ33880.1 UDP-galactose-lipid carrier transferase [Planctomycetaceae bacterium]